MTDWHGRMVSDLDTLFGKPRIKGARIGVLALALRPVAETPAGHFAVIGREGTPIRPLTKQQPC